MFFSFDLTYSSELYLLICVLLKLTFLLFLSPIKECTLSMLEEGVTGGGGVGGGGGFYNFFKKHFVAQEP